MAGRRPVIPTWVLKDVGKAHDERFFPAPQPRPHTGGSPRKAPEDKMVGITICVSRDLEAKLYRLANAANVGVGAYVRETLDRALKKA